MNDYTAAVENIIGSMASDTLIDLLCSNAVYTAELIADNAPRRRMDEADANYRAARAELLRRLNDN